MSERVSDTVSTAIESGRKERLRSRPGMAGSSSHGTSALNPIFAMTPAVSGARRRNAGPFPHP